MTKMFRSIFSAKEALNEAFQAYNSLQINQDQSRKHSSENIKIPEATFASFGIKVTVEQAEVGHQ